MSIAILTMAFVVFAKPIAATYPSLSSMLAPVSGIAYPWFVLIGVTITLLVGIISSYTHPMPAPVPAST